MNIEHIHYFIKASEFQNMTKTSLFLNKSQSTVSKGIKTLELQLGYPLFVRSGKELLLSEQGEKILPIAKELWKTMKGLRKADQKQGLKIGLTSFTLLDPFFTKYIEEKEPKGIRVLLESEDVLLAKMAEDETIIGIFKGQAEWFPQELEQIYLGSSQMNIYVTKALGELYGSNGVIKALEKLPLLSFDDKSWYHKIHLAPFLAKHPLLIRYQTSNPLQIKKFLKNGEAGILLTTLEKQIGEKLGLTSYKLATAQQEKTDFYLLHRCKDEKHRRMIQEYSHFIQNLFSVYQ